jgi:hypothetical protein
MALFIFVSAVRRAPRYCFKLNNSKSHSSRNKRQFKINSVWERRAIRSSRALLLPNLPPPTRHLGHEPVLPLAKSNNNLSYDKHRSTVYRTEKLFEWSIENLLSKARRVGVL